MQQLLTAVGSRWVAIRSVAVDRRTLHLCLELFPSAQARHPDVWLVSCVRVREFSLTDFDGGGLNFWDQDHPVLAQYTSPKASLRVRISDANRELALGVLFRAHVQAVDEWIDFERFVRPDRLFEDESESLTLAAPQFLLEAYAAALAKATFSTTVKVHKRRLYWDGRWWSERRYNPSLLHFGSSFVVAETFRAQREPVTISTS